MAQRNHKKQEFQDAAGLVASTLAGIFWEHFNALVIPEAGQLAASKPVKAVNRNKAAELLSVSVNTIDKMVRDGKLRPSNPVGRAKRYPLDQIEQLLRLKQ